MSEKKTLLDKWNRSLELMHRAHHEAASDYSKWNLRVGITISCVAAVVGTSILVNFGEVLPFSTYIQLIAAFLSFSVAALTGIQTFVNFPERSKSHHLAAAEFQRARRRLEKLTEYCKEEKDLDAGLDEVILMWYEALKSAPNLPFHIHKRTREKIYGKDA